MLKHTYIWILTLVQWHIYIERDHNIIAKEFGPHLQVQRFATSLLDHARTSYELEIMLNYDLEGEIWDPGETQTLERLKLALKCKQKAFVAHPNVQQLLATIW